MFIAYPNNRRESFQADDIDRVLRAAPVMVLLDEATMRSRGELQNRFSE